MVGRVVGRVAGILYWLVLRVQQHRLVLAPRDLGVDGQELSKLHLPAPVSTASVLSLRAPCAPSKPFGQRSPLLLLLVWDGLR